MHVTGHCTQPGWAPGPGDREGLLVYVRGSTAHPFGHRVHRRSAGRCPSARSPTPWGTDSPCWWVERPDGRTAMARCWIPSPGATNCCSASRNARLLYRLGVLNARASTLRRPPRLVECWLWFLHWSANRWSPPNLERRHVPDAGDPRQYALDRLSPDELAGAQKRHRAWARAPNAASGAPQGAVLAWTG